MRGWGGAQPAADKLAHNHVQVCSPMADELAVVRNTLRRSYSLSGYSLIFVAGRARSVPPWAPRDGFVAASCQNPDGASGSYHSAVVAATRTWRGCDN